MLAQLSILERVNVDAPVAKNTSDGAIDGLVSHEVPAISRH